MRSDELRYEMSGFVNRELLDRIEWIVDDDILLHDDTFKIHDKNEQEARHLSELYRVADNMDKKELAYIEIGSNEIVQYISKNMEIGELRELFLEK